MITEKAAAMFSITTIIVAGMTMATLQGIDHGIITGLVGTGCTAISGLAGYSLGKKKATLVIKDSERVE